MLCCGNYRARELFNVLHVFSSANNFCIALITNINQLHFYSSSFKRRFCTVVSDMSLTFGLPYIPIAGCCCFLAYMYIAFVCLLFLINPYSAEFLKIY